MQWWPWQFDGVELATGMPRWQAGTGPTIGRVVATLGGCYDADGDQQADLRLPYEATFEALLVASTELDLHAALDDLRALRGIRGELWCRGDALVGMPPPEPGYEYRWCDARCLQVEVPREVRHWYHAPVQMRFQILSGWHMTELTDSNTFSVNASPKTLTVANSGNRPVRDLVIKVTAGTGTLSAVTIAVSGKISMTFSDTITAGKTLEIDCGAWSVQNDGVDAFAAWTRNAGHTIAPWFELAPGDNTVVVTTTGGNNDNLIVFDSWDEWE